uniref:EGF-like domain-containing protein n=1 Tax=Heterorhabditis bacteriophora TaxID=37862 RepID=A0A1I7WYL3_HETBA
MQAPFATGLKPASLQLVSPSPVPIIPEIPTLQPPEIPKANPKLLAHNAARMIREIASFSDVHHRQNEDYGAVQTLMEAFFQSVADPKRPLQDFSAKSLSPQYDGTELGANRPLTNKLFESDMVLTVEQMKGTIHHKWKDLIRSALKHWESETCVRWQENGIGSDHIVFFRGSGMKEFIIRGTDGNFERRTEQEIEDMGLPYDLGSVMHYGPNARIQIYSAFTTDWDEVTIKTNDNNYQRTIGQRSQPSFIDVKQVNRLYCHGDFDSNDYCPANNYCQNGGYPDPTNCQQCKCPPGLAGSTCEEIPKGDALQYLNNLIINI